MMKKFRRLAALLLAGMMALMVFTGCGSAVSARDVEDTYLKYMNSVRTDQGEEELPNDPAIRQKALQMLRNIDPESGLIDYDETEMMIREYKPGGTTYTTIQVMTADRIGYNKSIALEVTPEMLANLKEYLAGQSRLRDNYAHADAIGVAAITLNGRTYLAYGYTSVMGLPD